MYGTWFVIVHLQLFFFEDPFSWHSAIIFDVLSIILLKQILRPMEAGRLFLPEFSRGFRCHKLHF